MTIKLIEKTIELTETDICTIQRALGFFEAALLTSAVDSIKDVGFTYIDRLKEIIDNAPADK